MFSKKTMRNLLFESIVIIKKNIFKCKKKGLWSLCFSPGYLCTGMVQASL